MTLHDCKAEWPRLPVKDDEWILVDSWDDVPRFANECEEAAWWANHSFSDRFFNENPPDELDRLPPPGMRSYPVSIGFDANTVDRLKAVAKKQGKSYYTLIQEFVCERLYEEEKREGIIGQ